MVITVSQFRALMPEFGDSAIFPDGAVLSTIVQVGAFFGAAPKSGQSEETREVLFALAVAHFLTLSAGAEAAAVLTGHRGNLTSSRIDAVHVTYQPPPNKTQSQFFWNQTNYGQKYLAMAAALRPVASAISPRRTFFGRRRV